MILDSSALISILRQEPDAWAFSEALAEAEAPAIAAPTLLETSIVAERPGWPALDALVARKEISVIPFTKEHALVARDAYARYGKGSKHPAKLNFGDCMSYALAKVRDEPLLFKGDDFVHTDIKPALPPPQTTTEGR